MSNSAKFLQIAGAFAAAAVFAMTSARAGVDTDQVTVTGATGSSATTPAVKVTGDGGVYFSAGNATSVPGVSSGNGLLFVPAKSALILGGFNSLTLANISSGSIKAEAAALDGGQISNGGGLAVGAFASASGYASVALGDAVADGMEAVAAAGGDALADSSFAATGGTTLGYGSTAFGGGTIAQASGSCVVGYYNIAEGDPVDNRWGNHPEDPVFVVGNGYVDPMNFTITRSNAFVVYRNGQIRIKEPQGDILMGDFD